MKRILLAAALLCAIIVAMPASADVIYDGGSPDLLNGYPSDTAYGAICADSFVLNTGSETITDIHWWGAYGDNQLPTDDFTIVIYGENGGFPDSSNILLNLAAGDVGQTATGDQIIGVFGLYEYSLDIDPLTLTAGNTYYLAIYNDVGSWYWATSSDGNGIHYRDGSSPYGDSFSINSDDLAFTLTNDNLNEGVVPEPASILLMGFGLGGVAWRARKKRNS